MVGTKNKRHSQSAGSRRPARNIVHPVIRVVLVLGLVGALNAAALAEDPTLVRFIARGDGATESVAGVLLEENDRDVTILDLETLRERTFDTDSLSSVKNPATEQEVSSLIGLAPLTAWFIAQSLPSRPESGSVASVDGAVSYINLGEQAGISEGETLNVFRGEQEIVDPETGEVLGTTRRRIAQVEVVEVLNRLSKVRLLGDFEVQLEVGDQVRPVSAENPVAVLPFGRTGGQLPQGGVQLAEEVTTYLIKNDVTVVERTLLDEALAELQLGQTGAFDPDTARRVGELLQAYAVVAGTIQANGREADVNVRLIEVETGRILYATSLTVRGLNLSRVVPAQRSPTPQLSNATSTTLMRRDFPEIRQFVGHRSGIRAAAFSADGRTLVSGSPDGTVRVWDVETGQQLRSWNAHDGAVINDVDISPDGQRVLSCGYLITGDISLWDAGTGRRIGGLEGHSGYARSVAFLPDGRRALSGGQDGIVRLWDLGTRQAIQRFDAGHHVWAVLPIDDGAWIASGDANGDVHVWDAQTGDLLRTMTSGIGGRTVTGLSVSPDGRYLASSGHGDDSVRLWDLNTGALVHHFTGHTAPVYSVSFSPDGRWLVSGSHDKTFRLWSLDDANVSTLFLSTTHCTTWSMFSPGGHAVLTHGGMNLERGNPQSRVDDMALHLWDVSAVVADAAVIGP